MLRNGIRIGVSTISSGKEGHDTPTGVFTILQKDRNHHSNIYHNAPMYFQERLTWGGVALHAGGLPGYPESHGCIHLPYTFSQQLFRITSLGGTVVVAGDAAKKVETAQGALISPMEVDGQPASPTTLNPGEYHWQPELSPKGPVSIVISKSDNQMVVYRNGIEIGRSNVEVDAIDEHPRVATLVASKGGPPRWIFVGLPGAGEGKDTPVDNDTLNRVHMPRPFYAQLKPAMAPGTTVLVTMSQISPATSGEHITIMDAVSPAE